MPIVPAAHVRCFSPSPSPRAVLLPLPSRAQLFLAVFLAGVPYDWGFKLSSLCLVLVSAALFLGVPFFLCRGGPLMLQAGKAVANEIGAATKPRP